MNNDYIYGFMTGLIIMALVFLAMFIFIDVEQSGIRKAEQHFLRYGKTINEYKTIYVRDSTNKIVDVRFILLENFEKEK